MLHWMRRSPSTSSLGLQSSIENSKTIPECFLSPCISHLHSQANPTIQCSILGAFLVKSTYSLGTNSTFSFFFFFFFR